MESIQVFELLASLEQADAGYSTKPYVLPPLTHKAHPAVALLSDLSNTGKTQARGKKITEW